MLFDEWGQSLQKSRQRLNVCLETKILERREGFLGARLLCRFLKCLWRFCKVLGALPPHYLSGYGGCVWARPTAGGREEGMGRVSAEEWLQCSDSGPGGRDSTGLSLFHPLVLHSGRGGRAWEGRETSFGRRAKAAVSPPKTVTISVNALTETPGWAKLLPHPIMLAGEGGRDSKFGSWRPGCPAAGSL